MSRVLKRSSVFLTDPDSLAVTRFVAGDEIPSKYKVGDHLFTDDPDWTGTPQTGSFGRVLPFGGDPQAGDTRGSDSYDPGEHNADEVVEYVGDDQARAAAVLEQERAGKNRKSVVEPLEKVANPQ